MVGSSFWEVWVNKYDQNTLIKIIALKMTTGEQDYWFLTCNSTGNLQILLE